jgi:hypothetical protein
VFQAEVDNLNISQNNATSFLPTHKQNGGDGCTADI